MEASVKFSTWVRLRNRLINTKGQRFKELAFIKELD